MDALISGRSGTGLLINRDGSRFFSLHADGRRAEIRMETAAHHVFGDATDIIFLEDVSEDRAAGLLRVEKQKEEALLLVLILLDPKQDLETRLGAAKLLETMIDNSTVFGHLESILFSVSPPEVADLKGAIEMCTAEIPRLRDMMERLNAWRTLIEETQAPWDLLPEELFDSPESRKAFRATAISEGLFRDAVAAKAQGETSDTFMLSCMLNTRIQALPRYRAVVGKWVEILSLQKEVARHQQPESGREKSSRHKKAAKKKRRVSIDRQKILNNVVAQKQAVIRAMQNHELARAQKIAEELVTYQLENGGAEYAVKSLCDLAIASKILGLISLQWRFTLRSIEIKPDDGWAWTQYGDALLNKGDYTDALSAYESALQFGGGVVAKTGRAEVLTSLNRFDEALSAYETAMREHPEDVVAKNGRAEVLTSLNRFDEALSAYDTVMREHPENVMARNGMAHVLGMIGNFQNALTYLPENVLEIQGDWVGFHIRGMIYMKMGDLAGAEAIFSRGYKECATIRHKEYFSTALSLVRIHQEAYAEAEELLDTVTSPEFQATANILRIQALSGQGRNAEAREAYRKVPAESPGICIELTEELRRRYLDDERPRHGEDWLREGTVRCLFRMSKAA